MKALLQTACGCSRMIDVGELTPVLNVPAAYLSPSDFVESSSPPDPRTHPPRPFVRRFEYVGTLGLPLGVACAHYREVR